MSAQKKKRRKRLSVESILTLPLERNTHPEDMESDEKVKKEIPRLRKIIQQKDQERLRQKIAEKAAIIAREKLHALTNTKNRRGGDLDLSEMDIAFDQNGKIMKVINVDTNKLGDHGKQQKSIIK